METSHLTEVKLTLQADLIFLPLATSFVEQSARAFGLGEPEALGLTLAAEEIFAYLCRTAAPGSEVQMHCTGRGYYVEQGFLFEVRNFNMRVFNLTASVPTCEPAETDETGLLIASRMVDGFRFIQKDKNLHIILTKEKTYPSFVDLPVPEARPLNEFSVRPPDSEELKMFVHLVNEHHLAQTIPMSFNFPGKVVDMVACGDFFVEIAADRAGHIGGGLIWHWDGVRLVEFYGPYLFNQPLESGMAQSLIESCIGAIARTHALGMINRNPTRALPTEYFDPLGSLTFRQRGGGALDMMAYYRHLEEDPGLLVWAHPSINAFVADEYQRLIFAREIRLVRDQGESTSPWSVISAELDRGSSRVTLHPIWLGNDSEKVLEAYVETLQKEEILNIFFQMDLGRPWHCHFTPALLGCGFKPRLLLPYAGKGDLVIFQHEPGESS